MARHSGVTFKSKNHYSNESEKADLLRDQFYRRAADAAHEDRFRLQVDRQTKESYQTREAAQKAGMAIKRAFPILHVAVFDAE